MSFQAVSTILGSIEENQLKNYTPQGKLPPSLILTRIDLPHTFLPPVGFYEVERCESGRIGQSRKLLSWQRDRGFDPHPLRQILALIWHASMCESDVSASHTHAYLNTSLKTRIAMAAYALAYSASEPSHHSPLRRCAKTLHKLLRVRQFLAFSSMSQANFPQS